MASFRHVLVLGLLAVQIAGSPQCTSSQCWRDGFDIYTDYEQKVPPGKLVKYDLTLSQKQISPDGYLVEGMVIKGQYPGPKIEANWGDTLRITIHNNFTNLNGTAVHFHGIRQLNTNYLDGVPGVTQCPSTPGASQVYEFRAMQYGTSWYHSHFSLQYTNGAYGPVQINGPTSLSYDVDLGPTLISDWYHADAFSLYPIEIDTDHAPLPATNLINGKGVFHCNPQKDPRFTGKHERYEVLFDKGKTYKLGVVNSGSLLTYKFWIDGHNFTVINNDFVSIEPYKTDVLIIGIGQRYEIVIDADANFKHGTNFWIHANYCGEDDMESRLGIIRYNKSDKHLPYTPPISKQHYGYGCLDPDPNKLVPIVKRKVGKNVNGMSAKDYLKIGLQGYPNISDPDSRIKKWVLKNRPMYLDWEEPTLKKLTWGHDPDFPPETAPITLDYETGEWVYFVITSNYTVSRANTTRAIVPSVHPIHLHGHDLVVLAQGYGPFHKDIEPNLDNPSRRDTTDVPIGGYVWIAFQVDNPGAWLMHCHIAWHASSGLAVQFIEQPSKLRGLLHKAGVTRGLAEQCREWTKHYQTMNIPAGVVQEDSGI